MARYARTLGEDPALFGLDTLRRVRNAAEYGGRPVGRAQTRHAIELAEKIILIVAAELE